MLIAICFENMRVPNILKNSFIALQKNRSHTNTKIEHIVYIAELPLYDN